MKLEYLAKDLVEMINFDDVSQKRSEASFYGDNYKDDNAYKPLLALSQISGEIDLNSAYGDKISKEDILQLVAHRDALDALNENGEHEKYKNYLDNELSYTITVVRN